MANDALRTYYKLGPQGRQQFLQSGGVNTDVYNRMSDAGKKGAVQRAAARLIAGQSGDVTAPLTPQAFNQEVNANVALQYGGQEQALQGQQRVNQQMQANVPAWYDNYLKQVDTIRQSTQAGYNQAVQQLQAGAQSMPQAQLAPNAGGEAQAVNQQAGVARQAAATNFQGLLGTLGANQNAYLGDTQRIGAARKLQAQQNEANRGLNLGQAAQQLAAEKGQYATKVRGDLRGQERTYQLGMGALNLNQQKAVSQSAHQALADALAQSGLNIRQSAADRQAARDKAQRENHTGAYAPAKPAKQPKPPRGPGSLTPQKESTIVSTINKAVSLIKRGPTQNIDSNGKDTTDPKQATGTRKLTDAEIRSELLNGASPLGMLDPGVVNAAMDIARRGGLSTPNVKAVQQLGVHVSGNWKVLGPRVRGPFGVDVNAPVVK